MIHRALSPEPPFFRSKALHERCGTQRLPVLQAVRAAVHAARAIIETVNDPLVEPFNRERNLAPRVGGVVAVIDDGDGPDAGSRSQAPGGER